MDFTKIKVIKKLGTGMVATVYLIKYNNKEYAMKKQKILEKDKDRSSRSVTWRELFFYEYVNKMPAETQKFFCKLFDYKIVDGSNSCVMFIIEYKGDTTLRDFMSTKLSTKQIYTGPRACRGVNKKSPTCCARRDI